ncbi:hypothetical protein WA026_021979 [Henosepilachna vigintioctopunctata]|uniref:Uncharacterized protein n=1 Tax=Henosepilachna vigintioctopunctata TaxID=420089 RepID=A0AAW1VIH0_9CUCU
MYIRKFNTESLSTESTRQLYELRLSSRLNNICIAGEVEEGWQQMKTCITEAAAESAGERTININANKNIKSWFCKEVKELADVKRKSYLLYLSSPTETNRTRIVENRNKANAALRAIKREHWRQFTSEMEHDLYGAQRKV